MSSISPTQRSLKLLRAEGYTAQVVEHWNSFAMRRIDLFGCIDIVAVRADLPGVLGVQCTSATNAAARLKKASECPALKVWLLAGNRFEVHAHGKRGPRGLRKVWTCNIRKLHADECIASNNSFSIGQNHV